MKNWPFALGGLVVGLIAVVLFARYYATLPPALPEPTPTTAPTATPPAVRYPVPTPRAVPDSVRPLLDPDQPLPTLAQSDEPMQAILTRLFADRQFQALFVPEHFIERCVVMIDSLPRAELPATHRPVRKVPGAFAVDRQADRISLAPANFARYRPLIEQLEALDPQTLVAVYTRLYPLFQQAYERIGYPNDHFNDRLVDVIDHLLTAPETSGPLALVQPQTLYQYADPQLEAESAGRKILLRVGPENARRIKELLRVYRQELTAVR